METKICTKCGVEKNIEEFRLKKTKGKYIRYSQCHECELEYHRKYGKKKWRKEHPIIEENEKLLKEGLKKCIKCSDIKPLSAFIFRTDTNKYRNECELCYKEEKKEYSKKYRQEHLEELKIKSKKYEEEHKEEIKIKRKIYNQKHKEERKKYREENKEKIKKYREENKEKIRESHNKYIQDKRNNDIIYKLKDQMRTSIRESFRRKGMNKSKHTEEIVGIPLDELYKYLLNTFKENYGYDWDFKEEVHIDHKYPLKYATTEEEVFKLCHYTNLQLLKGSDNLEKNDKLDWKLTKQD